ncbi:unnamed protein product [Nesidiocoris tenuis]|uniref:Uncharacterized protein n=1 Tax=Nesidiocoris tenuis TaxID=355587 RepID=A0A6H5GAH8_9HEMI|nr:unnamed protein product [Nesidiocoris tenuis]
MILARFEKKLQKTNSSNCMHYPSWTSRCRSEHASDISSNRNIPKMSTGPVGGARNSDKTILFDDKDEDGSSCAISGRCR